MPNMLLGWPNRVPGGTVVASAEVVGLGAGQVQNDQGSPDQAWQTPIGVTEAWLRLDAGYTGYWRLFGLHRTNLGVQAQVRWRVWQGADFADAALEYDSGYVQAGVIFGFGQHVHVAPGDVVGRAMQVDVYDPLNPDGFINVPLLYAGPAWQPRRNYGFASTMGRVSGGARTVTRAGAIYPRCDWMARTWDLVLPAVASNEVWGRVMSLDEHARRGNNVLFVPNPSGPDLAREALFGVLDPAAPLGYGGPSREMRTWRATITERL